MQVLDAGDTGLPAEAPTTPETPTNLPGREPTAGTTEQLDLAPAPLPEPRIPFPLPLRNVSGSYSGIVGTYELDLRVDVDGTRTMHRVSGDFVAVSGATHSYFGSFTVDSVTVTNTSAGMVIRGLGRFTFSAGAPVVQVTIPRRTLFQPAAPASVRFYTTANAPGALYVCSYRSGYFRTLTLQTEIVSDVPGPVFSSYNTGALPSGGPARNLSVVSAYAEAGIQMSPVAAGPVINIGEAGGNHLWSDAELLASMQRHFARVGNTPHWDMWQCVCWEHEIGPGLYGIMFDSQRRQGCAVFYYGIGGTTADKQRLQLYTHVHELGHCFNLMHSWQKSLARPPGVNDPGARSWMNYPWNFPGGANAFWNAFPFQYVDEEIIHMRHAFRNNVIPSGNPFTVGAEEIDPEVMADPIRDLSGLEFIIAPSQPAHMLGEPVVLSLRLRSFDRRGQIAHANLHPKTSGVSIAIGRPDGRVVRFDPLVDHLMESEPRLLTIDEQFTETAYIGYGKGGFYFDQPGLYKVRAIYHAPDGSQVMSNVTTVRVRYPVTADDNDLAELMIGDQQGALLALMGSDADDLAGGRAAFDTLLHKHGKSPMASYVRLVTGVNAARTFKTIDNTAPNRVQVRQPDLAAAASLLGAAADNASRLDNLSKAQGLERLAQAQAAIGDNTAATQTRQSSQSLRATHLR